MVVDDEQIDEKNVIIEAKNNFVNTTNRESFVNSPGNRCFVMNTIHYKIQNVFFASKGSHLKKRIMLRKSNIAFLNDTGK